MARSGAPSSSRSAYRFSEGTRPQPESRAKSDGTKLGAPRPLRSSGSKLSSPTSSTYRRPPLVRAAKRTRAWIARGSTIPPENRS
jgi:hypothetical protein